MKLLGQVFDGGDDADGGPVDGIANESVTTVSNGIENTPAGKTGEDIDVRRRGLGMRFRENQKFGLLADDFFET